MRASSFVLGLLVVSFILATNCQDMPVPSPKDGVYRGSPSASLVFEVYFSGNCDYAYNFFQNLQPVVQKYDLLNNDKFQLVYHNTPLPWVFGAFYWATAFTLSLENYGDEETGELIDQYFVNMNQLMPTNTSTTTGAQYINETIAGFVSSTLSVDPAAFLQDFYNNSLNNDARYTWKYSALRGVTYSPTIFANGVMVPEAATWNQTQMVDFLTEMGVITGQELSFEKESW